MAFSISTEELFKINVPQETKANAKELSKLGGSSGLLKKLKVNPGTGLTADIEARKEHFGSNFIPQPPPSSWLELFIGTFEDTTVIILMVSAVVSLAVGIYKDMANGKVEGGWIEGVAILTAVLIVAVVTATNDYTKEQSFRKLNAVSDDINIKVLRDGVASEINIKDLVVGDIVNLEAGDKVPGDGVFVAGNDLTTNESALTGEPDDLEKDDSAPFLLSGSQVSGGRGSMVCIAVGSESQWGKIKASLVKEETNTPLQDKLDVLAAQIGYVGMGSAAATFIAMMVIHYFNPEAAKESIWEHMLKAFIMAVTIVVVAVPEGLPLAVTISLAFSTKKMLADNNLIRVLAACETMGNATTICSDKTGTLTKNQMTVVQAWIAGEVLYQEPAQGLGKQIKKKAKNFVIEGLSVCSTAELTQDENGDTKVLGSATEGGLLNLVNNSGSNYSQKRKESFKPADDLLFPFNSERKRMTVVINGGRRLYCKGAGEAILRDCVRKTESDGSAIDLTPDRVRDLENMIKEWASSAFRVIALAHKDLDEPVDKLSHVNLRVQEQNLTLDALFAIQDPLRDDVIDAVKVCQDAGIMVRMVTGDNIDTAKAIAKQCGILTEDGQALPGPTFRTMTPAQVDSILPNLQVLARSSPEDKLTLVTRLNGGALPRSKEEWEAAHPKKSWAKDRDQLLPGYREEWERTREAGVGEVVGVTGDGTNDGPALRAADVGLSMGKSGTEIAKEASDIVIMDDRFQSIVMAVKWGRCVFDNIRKFLQFQLTVNVVALILTFLSAVIGKEPPLNAVMMLWVNLIMDTMGALALGTEAPTDALLKRKPYKRNASLTSLPMWRNILVQSTFQLVILLVILEQGNQEQFFGQGLELGSRKHNTIIFNIFVFCQVFNELNARSIGDDVNVFQGISTNWMFQLVIFFTVVTQFLIVEYGGDFTQTESLTGEEWMKTVVIGGLSLPLGVAMRFIPVLESQKDFAHTGSSHDYSYSSESKMD